MPFGHDDGSVHPRGGGPRTHAVEVGGITKPELLDRLEHAGVRLNEAAHTLFASDRLATAAARRRVDVVEVSVAALGFPDGATLEQAVARAATRGLEPCPLELAPCWRLQYADQPEGALGQPPTRHRAPPGAVTVVSAPPDGEDEPWGFYLRRIDGVLWLRGYRSWAGHVWRPDDVLAFAVAQGGADGPVAEPLRIDDFDAGDAEPLVRMWRESFEFGVGVPDPHTIAEQLAYLRERLLRTHRVQLARRGGLIVGFLAADAASVAQLYVRIGHLGQGIGTALLGVAKQQSSGSLWLYAFQRNLGACRFYERYGFVAVERGFEPSWQLADVKYVWHRAPDAA